MYDLLYRVTEEWERLYNEVPAVDRLRNILPLLRKLWDDEQERDKLIELWWQAYEEIDSAREKFYAVTRFKRFLHEKIKGDIREESYELPEV